MATTQPERISPSSDSSSLSHPMSFFAADPHVMTPQLDLHFPSRTHDPDSATLDDFGAALFGHPNLVSLDSALGLQHPILDPRRNILISTSEHDILHTGAAANTPNDHHSSSALRSQPTSQPRALSDKHSDPPSPPLQLQFIIGPECSKLDDSSTHIPSAASLYQVVHPNVDDVIVNFDTKASLAILRVSYAPLTAFLSSLNLSLGEPRPSVPIRSTHMPKTSSDIGLGKRNGRPFLPVSLSAGSAPPAVEHAPRGRDVSPTDQMVPTANPLVRARSTFWSRSRLLKRCSGHLSRGYTESCFIELKLI